jgi:hypothetical protein
MQLFMYPLRFSDETLPPSPDRYITFNGRDYPVAMQIIPEYALVYIVTRQGHIHLVDIESGIELEHAVIERPESECVVTSVSSCTNGLGITLLHDRAGKTNCLKSVTLVRKSLLSRLIDSGRSLDLSMLFRLASRNDEPTLFIQHHLQLCLAFPKEAATHLHSAWCKDRSANSGLLSPRSPMLIVPPRQFADTRTRRHFI